MKTNKKITAGKAPTDDLTVRAANISLVLGDTDDHPESEPPLDVTLPVRLDEGWYLMSLDYVDDKATFSVDRFSLEAEGGYKRLPDGEWVWVDGTAQSSFYLARSTTTTAAFKIENTKGRRWAGRAILSGPYPYDPLASSSSPKSSSSHGSHGHSSESGHSSSPGGFSSSSGKPESSSHSPSSSPGSSSKSSSHSPSSTPGSSSGSSSGHKPGSSSSSGHKPGSSSGSSSESSSSESSSSESSSSSSESSSSESSSSESSSSESSSSSCCCRCHGCGVLLGTNGGVLVEGNALVLCTEGCSSMSGSSSYEYVCVEFDSSSDSFDDSLSFEPLDFTESSDI